MPFVTCQYPEGFRWLTSHPKPRVEKLKRDKFGNQRSSEDANRLKIDTDFVQSDWPAWKKRQSIKILRNPIGWLCNFGYNQTGFLPWECHRHPTEQARIRLFWYDWSRLLYTSRIRAVVQDGSVAPQTISTCPLNIENFIYYKWGMQK